MAKEHDGRGETDFELMALTFSEKTPEPRFKADVKEGSRDTARD
jgi:hypothetical protein